MKLLQTGDLHLGKTLHETSLIPDQRLMLEDLLTELENGRYDALAIAGDVYDRTIPPAEAVTLFGGFLVELRARLPELDVFIIPGNHDSAQRLSFAGPLLGSRRIYIICDPEDSFTPIVAGKGDDRVAFFLLPFLAPGSLGPDSNTQDSSATGVTQPGLPQPAAASALPTVPKPGELEFDFSASPTQAGDSMPIPPDDKGAAPKDAILASQAELAAEAAKRFQKALAKPEIAGIPTVLIAHCFALGGASSESERAFLGGAERVDPALFSGFTWVALGHLHRSQRVGERIHYAGAPLAYAFDEADAPKSFLRVEIDSSSSGFPVAVTPVPIEPLRRVARLTGDFESFYRGAIGAGHENDYLEITLTDPGVVANPMNLLKTRFPWLLSVRQEALESEGAGKGDIVEKTDDGAKRSAIDDFRAFELGLYGESDPEKEALFSSILEEATREA